MRFVAAILVKCVRSHDENTEIDLSVDLRECFRGCVQQNPDGKR